MQLIRSARASPPFSSLFLCALLRVCRRLRLSYRVCVCVCVYVQELTREFESVGVFLVKNNNVIAIFPTTSGPDGEWSITYFSLISDAGAWYCEVVVVISSW